MSSFIERLRSRMTGSLAQAVAPKPDEPKVRQTIVTNRWDERVWTDVRKQDEVDKLIYDLSMGDEHKGGERKPFDPAPELTHDLFMSLFKAAPTMVPREQVHRDAWPVRKIMKEVLESPKLQEFQEITATKPIETLIAMNAMREQITEILTRIPPPPPPPQPGGQQGQGGGQGGGQGSGQGDGDPGQEDGQGGGQNPGQDPNDPGQEGDGNGQGNGQSEAESQAQDEYEKQLDDLDIDRLMNKALDAASKEVEDLDNMRRGIGLEDGEWATMSPEDRLKMAENLRTPEMKLLAEVVGRMKRQALSIRATRVNDVPHEAFDVETGNDIRRVLRSEFALLATEGTKHEFYRRYVDRELLQYKMRGKEDAGKGPIVVVIDKSGSMQGEPFNWAMGVAEALRRFASDDGRDYHAIFFGNNNDRNVFEFPKGKAPFEQVLRFLSVRANGGTQFDGVLTDALERASKAFDGEGRGKADIVFITDGLANLDDAWIARYNTERERASVRQFSVFIGGRGGYYSRNDPKEFLGRFSDVVIPVTDFKPEAVKTVFERI